MQLWTGAHARTLLPTVVIMSLVAFFLRKWLGEKDRRIRLIPLQIVSVLLVAIEIGKQLVSFSRGYDLYHIPLHFCSLFIFALPVMAFYRGRHTQTVSAIVSSLCTAVFLMMMLYPCLIYSEHDILHYFTSYMCFHTVTFHNLVIFAFLLILALRLYEPSARREGRELLLVTLCFCLISATMAQVLKTNFNNFYSCNIAPLETLRRNVQTVIGRGLTQLLYVCVVSALNILFLQMSLCLNRGLYKVCRKKNGT